MDDERSAAALVPGQVRAKKSLGQHFLTHEETARRIVKALEPMEGLPRRQALEVGPGMGVLTKYMLADSTLRLRAIEVDHESVAYLRQQHPSLDVVEGDFLRADLAGLFHGPFALIGNFPYNISSQILFRVLECRDRIPLVVGMFQKEVAQRVAAGPGSKTYGILSVLLGAFYHVEMLFGVAPGLFAPPPKVDSAVIRLRRNDVARLACDETLFAKVVKAGFGQRRKTLRNALRPLGLPLEGLPHTLLTRRAEQLSVEDFVNLTLTLERQ